MPISAHSVRALIIVNPEAGAERPDLAPVLAILRSAGFSLEVEEARLPDRDAESLALAAIADGYEALIAAGGDGTVGAVARALVGTDRVLGILPTGTFMNIARSIGIPRDDLVSAARLIADRHVRRIDAGRAGGQAFFEAAGIGLDADAVTAGRAVQRGSRGIALAALGALLRRRSARVVIDVDGRQIRRRVLQAVVSNGPYYGWGFEVSSQARLDDGQLDLAIFGDSRSAVLRELLTIAIRRDHVPRGRRYRGSRISMSAAEPLAVHADGVVVGDLPQTFECVPGALRVFAG